MELLDSAEHHVSGYEKKRRTAIAQKSVFCHIPLTATNTAKPAKKI